MAIATPAAALNISPAAFRWPFLDPAADGHDHRPQLKRGPAGGTLTSTSKKASSHADHRQGPGYHSPGGAGKRRAHAGTDVAFEIEAGSVRLVKTKAAARATRGQRLIESLRGGGDFKMSTDDIVALMRGPPADEG